MSYQPPLLDFNYETNKGMLFDVRDGQSYQVVKIGNQIWLAENFRYLPSKEKGDPYCNSWVYENNNDYLDKGYGRLYDWNTAMNIAPEGWRLPNNKDFEELRDFVIKDNNLDDEDEVRRYLKSVNGWYTSKGIVNNDKYGFNAKPVGFYRNSYKNADFYGSDYNANFWSATEGNNSDSAYYWYLDFNLEDFNSYYDGKDYGFSVRCLKDS